MIQALRPLRTYVSPSRTARVVIDATSLPACGSERQYEPCQSPLTTRGTTRAASSAEAWPMIGAHAEA